MGDALVIALTTILGAAFTASVGLNVWFIKRLVSRFERVGQRATDMPQRVEHLERVTGVIPEPPLERPSSLVGGS